MTSSSTSTWPRPSSPPPASPPRARMQGRDFAPLYLAAEKPTWRDEFFYEHATIRNTDFIPSSEALVRKD